MPGTHGFKGKGLGTFRSNQDLRNARRISMKRRRERYFSTIFIPAFDIDLDLKIKKLTGLITFVWMQKKKRENNK